MIETKTAKIQTSINYSDVDVVIFRMKNFSETLLEKPMIKWVEDVCKKFSPNVVDYDYSEPELSQIINNLGNKKYTMVLFSFTPLLTSKNIMLCLDYLFLKDYKLIKMTYGYAFETEYLKNINEIKEPVLFSGDSSEFLKVQSKEEVSYAKDVLQRRIIQNLLSNNVEITNPANVVINAYVVVEGNVTIFPFNTLTGKTIIKSNVVLKEGNYISDSEIGAYSIISNSTVKESTVGSNCIVYPFNTIENNCFIGANSTIKSHNQLNNTYLEDNTIIESFNDMGENS